MNSWFYSITLFLTLLHSEQPKLHTVSAVLSAIELIVDAGTRNFSPQPRHWPLVRANEHCINELVFTTCVARAEINSHV